MHHVERSGYYEKLGAGIVLTGGGAMLSHLPELTKLKTGLDVRIGASSRAFSDEESRSMKDASFSSSVGLLIAAGQYPGVRIPRDQMLFDDVTANEPTSDKKQKSSNKTKKQKRDKKIEYITGDLFGNIKRNIAGIFDERDTEM
jgi:cell division protein FtsA